MAHASPSSYDRRSVWADAPRSFADLVAKEQEQIDVFMLYLPAQASDEELEAGMKEIIAQTGATTMKDIGKVMGAASKKFAGVADGKRINEMVKKLLA